jgi:hypothetical protein
MMRFNLNHFFTVPVLSLIICATNIAISSNTDEEQEGVKKQDKSHINLLRTAARGGSAPPVEKTSEIKPCNPKQLTYEQLKAIFLPNESDIEILPAKSGRDILKTRLEIQTSNDNSEIIYAESKSLNADSLRAVLSNETGQPLYATFIEYLMKNRLDVQTLESEIEQACVAGYRVFYADNTSVFKDKNELVYIAFTKTKGSQASAEEDTPIKEKKREGKKKGKKISKN